jgi:hypothetical protein
MYRLILGIGFVLVCGTVRAGDPPANPAPGGGKPDQFSRSIFEQQQGRPEGSANPTQEGVPVQQLATGTYTPPPGSPERAAIMDGIRGQVVGELRQPVIFKVEFLRVRDGWAFLKAQPRRPDGGPIDYRKTKFREAVAAGAFDGGVLALLKRSGTRWEAVDWTLGATDLPYGDWWKKYRTPKSIFDYAEP